MLHFGLRVVVSSSSAHRLGGINFDNLNIEGEYHPWVAYAQSKTANLYTASQLERRYGKHGVHAYSARPGLIQTGLMMFLVQETLDGGGEVLEVGKATKDLAQGAATTVWAAVAEALEGTAGKYLE